jgi:hypothetical protein
MFNPLQIDTGREGYISRADLLDNPQQTKPIVLCLGCSFTNNGTTLYPKNNYPFHLHKAIRKDYVVCNSGVVGGGTWIQLILAQHYPVCPDLVIFQLMESARHPERIQQREYVKLLPELINSYPAPRVDSSKRRGRPLTAEVDTSYFFQLISIVMGEILIGVIDEEETRGNWPYCCAERIVRDMDNVGQLRSMYTCPFIYLVNDRSYPYEHSFSFALDELRQILHPEDEICLTSFDGAVYQTSVKDGHPNKLRAKLTASALLPIMSRLLN